MRVLTAAISGVPEVWDGDIESEELVPTVDSEDPSRLIRVCGEGDTDVWAIPAPRLAELVVIMSGSGLMESTCSPDYANALATVGRRIAALMGE